MKLRVRVGEQQVGVQRACARAHSYCSIVCKRGVSVLATVWCAGAGVRGTGAAASARAGGGVRNGSAVRGCVSSGACMLRQWCVRVCVPDRGMGSWVRTEWHDLQQGRPVRACVQRCTLHARQSCGCARRRQR